MSNKFIIKNNIVICGNCGQEISNDSTRPYYICKECALKLTEKAEHVTKTATIYDPARVVDDYTKYFGQTLDDWYDWAEGRYQEAYEEAWSGEEIPEYDRKTFESFFFEEWEKHKNDKNDTELYDALGEIIYEQVC